MTRFLFIFAALATLASCAPRMSGSGSGSELAVIDSSRAARDAELRGAPGSFDATGAPLSATGGFPIEADTVPGQDVPGQAANTAAVTNAVGLSQEQDFDAVSGERNIDDDAARIAAARAQYQTIEPGALPTRSGSNVPNIVEYALRTNNPRGTQLYSRSSFNAGNRYARNCGRYPSPDIAQEEFLLMGGPQDDRRGLDPDGDGFACEWDPEPFRRVRASGTSGADGG